MITAAATFVAVKLPARTGVSHVKPKFEPRSVARQGGASVSDVRGAVEVAALTPIYEADRAENSSGTIFAILGAGAAYLTATLAFSNAIFRSIGWVGIFAPLPLWLIAAYQSLLTGVAMVRSLSVRAIEAKLLRETSLSEQQKQAIGLQASEKIMNVDDAYWPHKIANYTSYVGIGFLVIGYTLYIILKDPHLAGLSKTAACISYAFLAGIVVASWITNFKRFSESAKAFK